MERSGQVLDMCFRGRSDGWRGEVKEEDIFFDSRVFVLSNWKNGPFIDVRKVEGQANLFPLCH